MDGKTTLAQYDVDDFCRVYTADGLRTFSKLYGMGVGYPQRRSDGMQLPKRQSDDYQYTFYKYPRVDSFDLYRNYVGTAILNRIYPKKKLENNKDFITLRNQHQIMNASNGKYHAQ